MPVPSADAPVRSARPRSSRRLPGAELIGPWLRVVKAIPRQWLFVGGVAGLMFFVAVGLVVWAVVTGGRGPEVAQGSGDPPPSTPVDQGEDPSSGGRTRRPPSQSPARDDRPGPDPQTRTKRQGPDAPRRTTPDRGNPTPRSSGGAARKMGGGGLTGVTRDYDDLACQQLQYRYGIPVPAAATILEVDGVRLPVDNPFRLADSPAPVLFLPRGVHAVRFRSTERPVRVEIDGHLFDEYQAMRDYFGLDGSIDGEALMKRAAWAMDVHGAPFLLNFMGARHAKEDRWDVARRTFRRSLCVNPTFSPAHLNLAECLLRADAREEAIREVDAAAAFNVGNVYGLAGAISRLRARLKLPPDRAEPVDAGSFSYVSTEPLTDEDRRLVALVEGISKYAVKAEERGKMLNNLAVHFADTGRVDLALYHFRTALAAVKYAGPARFKVAQKILSNMGDVCRKAGLDEADEYQRMQHLVTP